MILSEDYIQEYKLFLAEQELYSSLYQNIYALTEAESADIICEGLQDTLVNYMNKVTNNIQEVWTKFTSTVGNDKHKAYLTKSADKVKAANPRFVINNYPNYDINIFKSYKVQRYDRQTMSDDLKTQKEFMKKYYSSLYSERNNMNVMLQRNVIRGYINIRCDKSALTKAYNFCSRGFYEVRKSIEDDINRINEATNSITQSLQMVQNAQESVAIYESIILEAIRDPQNPNKATKMSFVDNDGSKHNPGAKSSENQNSIINQITNYFKISANLISAKMKVLSGIYKVNLNIVRHYVDTTQYGEPVPNNKVQKVQTQTES